MNNFWNIKKLTQTLANLLYTLIVLFKYGVFLTNNNIL